MDIQINNQAEYDAVTNEQWDNIYITWDYNIIYDLWCKFDPATIEYEAALLEPTGF